MVRKLFKHELKAYLRVLLIVWAGMLGVALLARGVQFFEQDSTVYDIVNGSSILAYVVGLLACMAFPFILAIVRFYRNLFTGEGYLTFTLPVTSFGHIWVKLAAGVVMQAATVLVMLLSAIIILSGDVLAEVFKAGDYLLTRIYTDIPELKIQLPLYFAEFLLLTVVSFAAELLLYYTCICVGQLTRKNRILTAVGVYFGYYFTCQILQTILTVLITFVPDMDKFLQPIFTFADKHPYGFFHLLLGGIIVLSAGLGVAFFAISHAIVSKKLNLE